MHRTKHVNSRSFTFTTSTTSTTSTNDLFCCDNKLI